MATSEVEQPAVAVNGIEKHEAIENDAPAEQPAPESAPESAPEKEPESSPAPVANGEELKKQKSSLRFRMPKNLRNLFGKKTDVSQNGENGHHENGQNGHAETHEEAKAPDAVSIGCAGKMRNVFKKVKPGHVDKRPIDKTEEIAKQGNDDSKKEKLEAVVKNNLLGGGLVDRAAVCTQDGLIAANSCEFHPTAEQVQDCVKLINGKSEDAVGKSLKVADQEYVCTESVEGISLLGKHQPKKEDDAAPADGEAAPESFVFIQLAQTHVVIAAYSAAQRSSTHTDDLKAAMNEITKSLRDDGL